jgi:hypothetical protein
MACTRFADLDKENPNYQFLADAMEDGRISLDEDRCLATIIGIDLEAKFILGMTAYLKSQGYTVVPVTASFPEGD